MLPNVALELQVTRPLLTVSSDACQARISGFDWKSCCISLKVHRNLCHNNPPVSVQIMPRELALPADTLMASGTDREEYTAMAIGEGTVKLDRAKI